MGTAGKGRGRYLEREGRTRIINEFELLLLMARKVKRIYNLSGSVYNSGGFRSFCWGGGGGEGGGWEQNLVPAC